jgi:xanthine dehydrogenase accessory factor
MRFEHRLAERGIDVPGLARMVCPIGLPGIEGKEPGVIAASVVAQLLQVSNLRQP